MNDSATILIVEDDWIVARAVEKTLEAAGYGVTDVVGCAHEALSSVERQKPDLALVDIGLCDDDDGIELARELRHRQGIPVVYVTAHSDAQTLARAADTHPAGYVLKPFQEGQLLSAVTIALAQRGATTGGNGTRNGVSAHVDAVDLADSGRQRLLRSVAEAVSSQVPSPSEKVDLTARELEVVRLLLSNGRVRSIAEDLDISPHTVRNHLRSIFRKLDVHSQVELIQELTAAQRASS